MWRRASVVVCVVVLSAWAAGTVAAVAYGVSRGPQAGSAAVGPRSLLFVQNARGGSYLPVPGNPGKFRLILQNVDPSALFFSDRPARDTGLLAEKWLLRALFAKGRPLPNAAVQVLGAPENEDVLAVKLTKPRYNARTRTLSYVVVPLRQIPSPGLRQYRARADSKLAPHFGTVSVFIDGSSGGNLCSADVANNTSSPLSWQSEFKWSTDSWVVNPKGLGIPNNGNLDSAGQDQGGFARGCHFSTTWTFNDGSTLTMETTDPYSAKNSFSCQASIPSKYQCTLDPSSIIHLGPILIVHWTVNQVS